MFKRLAICALALALGLAHPVLGQANPILTGQPTRLAAVSAGTADVNTVEVQISTALTGYMCKLNVTAGTTLLLDLNMQVRDTTGTWVDYAVDLPSAGGVTGVSVTNVMWYPTALSGTAFAIDQVAIPVSFRIQIDHGNANAATYTLDCQGVS